MNINKNEILINSVFLEKRANSCMAKGFSKQKWISFCEVLISKGFSIKIYEARETVSKYITVFKDGKYFRVRFSNHKPNYTREKNKDCDFFVGVTHTGIRTTEDALKAIGVFYGIKI